MIDNQRKYNSNVFDPFEELDSALKSEYRYVIVYIGVKKKNKNSIHESNKSLIEICCTNCSTSAFLLISEPDMLRVEKKNSYLRLTRYCIIIHNIYMYEPIS